MKIENTALKEENSALKQSLAELIKINNELTDSLEEINAEMIENKNNP